jgi:hypothetical protein
MNNTSIKLNMGPAEWAMVVALSIVWGGSFFTVGIAVQELVAADHRRVPASALLPFGLWAFSQVL